MMHMCCDFYWLSLLIIYYYLFYVIMLFSTAPVLLQYCINLNREQSKSIWSLAIQERLFFYTFQHDSELDC